MSTLVSMFLGFRIWNLMFIGFIIVLIQGGPRFNIMPFVRVRVFLGLSEAFLKAPRMHSNSDPMHYEGQNRDVEEVQDHSTLPFPRHVR